ncbi:uncharacterized protein EDB91DRAFT_1134218 [Suillus paluster]|uniref:uncharacterized protein n=1 Tax=Suillus paluster TaxID=48578 RepID=UPI001B87457D|nr:uncharacterized protein EDB91DRAFT_1134218 [Suillus paluster]KAG1739871.1 hypothetical protein EDB91DRAFT_1134218 [Suillus paluster]
MPRIETRVCQKSRTTHLSTYALFTLCSRQLLPDDHCLYMPLDIIPVTVDPETLFRMEQSGQPVTVYDCELQGTPCGMCMEGTTGAVSAHLRGHGMTSPDSAITICTWGGCSKTLKNGSMARHILAHLGVKVRCSVCGVVKCRHDILRAHIKSAEPCHLAIVDNVDGPGGRMIVPEGWVAAHMHQV